MSIFYRSKSTVLFLDDSLDLLKKMRSESVELVVADPPYFLSNGGMSNTGGRKVSVDKGDWDKLPSRFESTENFYEAFLCEAKRVLKKDGTIWIFGSFHNIYQVGHICQQLGFQILNNITWQKGTHLIISVIACLPILPRP